MPKVRANNLTMNYDQQGAGDPLILSPTSLPITPVTPFRSRNTPSTSLASRSILAEPEKATSLRRVPTRSCRRRRRRLHGRPGNPAGARGRPVLGRRDRHVAGRQVSGKGQVFFAPQCRPKTDAFQKPVVEAWQIMARATGSVAELIVRGSSLVLDTGAVRSQAGVHPSTRRFGAEPAGPTAGSFRASVERRPRSRRRGPAEADPGADPDHVRAPRHGDLHPIRGSADERLPGSELVIFEDCAHAPIYESVDEFNQRTLAFLRQHAA